MWKKSERIKGGFSKDKNVYRVVSKIEWGLRMSEQIILKMLAWHLFAGSEFFVGEELCYPLIGEWKVQ